MKKILVIAAHPDDETLGCGGLFSKYQNEEVTFKVLFIGEGSSCRYEDPASKDSLDAIKLRNSYASEALKSFDIMDPIFCNLACGRLDTYPILEINKIIENTISEFKPDTVFTHSAADANNDHKIIFNSTIMATRPCNDHRVVKLYSYEVLSSSEWLFAETFKPNVFISLSEEDIQNKCKAMLIYESEIRPYPFPRSSEAIRAQSMSRGTQSGNSFAEAFCLIREFV